MEEEFNLTDKINNLGDIFTQGHISKEEYIIARNKIDEEFIQRRIERIKLIIKLYPHKHGEELSGQLIEDLINDAGDKLI